MVSIPDSGTRRSKIATAEPGFPAGNTARCVSPYVLLFARLFVHMLSSHWKLPQANIAFLHSLVLCQIHPSAWRSCGTVFGFALTGVSMCERRPGRRQPHRRDTAKTGTPAT